VVIVAHVVDPEYLSLLAKHLTREPEVRLILDPGRDELAALYSAATVFVTASTSHFETFGRAPAEGA
jgi:glycosyltransferase involved in cell wall biosynthesis